MSLWRKQPPLFDPAVLGPVTGVEYLTNRLHSRFLTLQDHRPFERTLDYNLGKFTLFAYPTGENTYLKIQEINGTRDTPTQPYWLVINEQLTGGINDIWEVCIRNPESFWTYFGNSDPLDLGDPLDETETWTCWKKPDGDIIVKSIGYRNDESWTERMLSVRTAVSWMHETLMGRWRIKTISEPRPTPKPIGTVRINWYRNEGSHYASLRGNAIGDYDVRATLQKDSEHPIWVVIDETAFPDRERDDSKTDDNSDEVWLIMVNVNMMTVFTYNLHTASWYQMFSDQEEVLKRHFDLQLFQNVHARNSGQWRFVENLHTKGHPPKNIVSLFALRNDDGHITERMVLKYLYDADDEAAAGRNRREIYLHSVLSQQDTRYIVAFRGVSIRTHGPSTYRLFLEYAPHGSLDNVFLTAVHRNTMVPEIFIWLLLQALIGACQQMESVGRVHMDIKPDNVFLRAKPGPTEPYPGYPVPVLGDFGLNDPLSLTNTRYRGTAGFLAPEQADATAGIGIPPTKVHVYAIAVCAWCLMRRRELAREGHVQHEWIGQQIPFQEDNDPALYSQRLESFLKHCLQREISDRPTLIEMSQKVQAAINDFQRKYPGIESSKYEDLPEWLQVSLPAERFPVGTDVDVYSTRRHAGDSRDWDYQRPSLKKESGF
ncbi:kinase-like domain-containing protein [Dendryphion nanum]|uniref:Kinase-like domain-containing protein n=1 Tax=Dendryphion nanum TaxID=256645 RepID=A0A9P9EJV2_9PLEO|nr:kinase-like domain-containing protein [Dendryphion nanum]